MKASKLFLFLGLGVTMALNVSSCSDYTEWSESEIKLDVALKEYTENFESRFGKIDPNHTWGFGPIVASRGATTRADDGGSAENPWGQGQSPNKNEWVPKYHLHVPGQPDIYYMSNGSQVDGGYRNYEGGKTTIGSVAGNLPAGDVTDEEIAYVSWWFRTHRYPSSLNIHWSDFFIQEVSADNDRDANGNLITTYSCPEFNLQTDGSWSNTRYEAMEQYTIDQLRVRAMHQNQDAFEQYDHIYNFNSGASNTLFGIDKLSTTIQSDGNYGWEDLSVISNSTRNVDKRMIAFYQSSGTEDWAAHYSNDERWRNNYVDKSVWVMVHLHFIGQSGRIYDGYYLGFDYAFHKVEGGDTPNKYQLRKPDGYYNNWILKLSPGVPITTTEADAKFTRRIMCEDLGSTFDLDFDDVVFDATMNMTETDLQTYTKGNDVDVTVSLMAAGGTMPIWVGKDPNHDQQAAYEAHDLFERSRTTPVNVAKGADAPMVNYHTTIQSVDFDDINIWVYNTKIGDWVKLPKAADIHRDYVGPGSLHYDSSKSNAPQKFAVQPTALWLKETHQIEDGYPHFKDWVNEVNGEYKTDYIEGGVWKLGANPWYAAGPVASHLCGTRAETPASTLPTPGQISTSGVVGTTSPWASVNTFDVIPFVNNKAWGTVTVTDGTYNPSTDGYTFKAGKKARLVATPKEGYEFDHWGNCTGSPVVDSNNEVTVDGTKYVVAYFREKAGAKSYTVTLTGNHINPYISDTQPIGTNYYAQDGKYFDAQINLNYDNLDGAYEFIGWYINGSLYSENGNCEVKISETQGYHENITIEARTAKKVQLPVTVKIQGEDGNVIENPGDVGCTVAVKKSEWDYPTTFSGLYSGNYVGYVGLQVMYEITTADGYTLVSHEGLSNTNGTLTMLEGMSSVTVIFRKNSTTPTPEEARARKAVRRR